MAIKSARSVTCLVALSCSVSAFSPLEQPWSFGRYRASGTSSASPVDAARAFAKHARRATASPSAPLQSSTFSEDQMSMPAGFHVLHPDKIGSGYHKSSLSAATLDMPADLTFDVDEYIDIAPRNFAGDSKIMEVISASLLITGNTVGAGMMALPDVAAGPGMAMSTTLFFGIFGVNLISGLLLAEVAIKQNESSGGDVSSSFKEFADVTLESSTIANMISSISIFVNWCILSFALMEAGGVAASNLPQMGLDSTMAAAGVAALLAGMVGTQTNHALSRFASVAVSVLFASFAGLVLPGLANVHDPIGTFFAPGTCDGDMMGALTSAAPIFVTTLVYQNIVPSVTKLLDYDRTRTTIAIILGSLMPLCIYEALCFTVLGGGMDSSMTSAGPLLTAFAASSLAGSSVAAIMSIAEEFDNMIFKQQDLSVSSEEISPTTQETKGSIASIPSVLLATIPPLVAGAIFAGGEDFTAALNCAGSYGSPLLYGFLPVAMAWTQRKGDERKLQDGYNGNIKSESNLVPGGAASLGLLGVASAGFMFQEVAADMSGVLSSVVGLA